VQPKGGNGGPSQDTVSADVVDLGAKVCILCAMTFLPPDHYLHVAPDTDEEAGKPARVGEWARTTNGTYILLSNDALLDRGRLGLDIEDLGGVQDFRIGDAFAVMVLLCDGFVALKDTAKLRGSVKGGESRQRLISELSSGAASQAVRFKGAVAQGFVEGVQHALAAHRFFRLAARLPMELQMLLSHRLQWSPRNCVLPAAAEEAFRALVRRFHPERVSKSHKRRNRQEHFDDGFY